MRDKHAPLAWRPSPATKPTHLATTSVAQPQAQLAALRGATTAFASSPTTTSPSVKQVRGLDEGVSEPSDQDAKRGRLPLETARTGYTETKRSRSRGRHLSPQDAHSTHARSAAMSASSSLRQRPALTSDRSQSMIAARLVSSSPSPVRSNPSASPPNEATNTTEKATYKKGSTNQKSQALSINAGQKPISHSKDYASSVPLVGVSIDFDALPKLLPVLSEPLSHAPRSQEAKEKVAISRDSSTHDNGQSKTSAFQHKAATSPSAFSQKDGLLSPPERHFAGTVKPPLPSPRRGRAPVLRPLQQSLTGPKPGETREEAISRMADAMVASSLASSRPSSPGKPYRSHLVKQRSASSHDLHKLRSTDVKPAALPPKPPKPMKQTLRKHSSDNEDNSKENAKRGRRHLVRKHPNMHHEGDRKRWRDKVTELERKRYEGVFAANRGLLLKPGNPNTSPSRVLDPNSENNMVVNIIVRDIWERSRLSSQVLEQIYDLVAPEEPLFLNREQFVVGLWLIDQKLKGRKLPVRVSPSVWASVRHLHGIKLGKTS